MSVESLRQRTSKSKCICFIPAKTKCDRRCLPLNLISNNYNDIADGISQSLKPSISLCQVLFNYKISKYVEREQYLCCLRFKILENDSFISDRLRVVCESASFLFEITDKENIFHLNLHCKWSHDDLMMINALTLFTVLR